jgi:hypothetical protein
MHPYSSAEWESLFLAEAGASAALAGLLFVALSINLERILKGAGLPGRAGEAIVLLLTVLVVSTWVLVPGQSPTVLGAELLGSGLFALLILVAVHLRAVRGHVAPSRRLDSTDRAGTSCCPAAASRRSVADASGGRRALLAGPRRPALLAGRSGGRMGAARRDPPLKRPARHQQDGLRPPALGKVGGLCSETSHDGYTYSLRT